MLLEQLFSCMFYSVSIFYVFNFMQQAFIHYDQQNA